MRVFVAFLDVKVQFKFSWMWMQANLVNFLLALKINPSIDEIFSTYATLEQEFVISLEIVKNLIKWIQ